jgi:hypothetical protein
VPVFEKLLADGTIVEYEIDREMIHTTVSRGQLHFSFVTPSAEALDKFARPLALPSMRTRCLGRRLPR